MKAPSSFHKMEKSFFMKKNEPLRKGPFIIYKVMTTRVERIFPRTSSIQRNWDVVCRPFSLVDPPLTSEQAGSIPCCVITLEETNHNWLWGLCPALNEKKKKGRWWWCAAAQLQSVSAHFTLNRLRGSRELGIFLMILLMGQITEFSIPDAKKK